MKTGTELLPTLHGTTKLLDAAKERGNASQISDADFQRLHEDSAWFEIEFLERPGLPLDQETEFRFSEYLAEVRDIGKQVLGYEETEQILWNGQREQRELEIMQAEIERRSTVEKFWPTAPIQKLIERFATADGPSADLILQIGAAQKNAARLHRLGRPPDVDAQIRRQDCLNALLELRDVHAPAKDVHSKLEKQGKTWMKSYKSIDSMVSKVRSEAEARLNSPLS